MVSYLLKIFKKKNSLSLINAFHVAEWRRYTHFIIAECLRGYTHFIVAECLDTVAILPKLEKYNFENFRLRETSVVV